MPFSNYGGNWMLDSIFYNRGASRVVYASLHTNDPGASGSYEAAGGTPAYQRQAVTVIAANAKAVTLTTPYPVFNVAAGTYTHVGFWDSQSGPNFIASSPLSTYPPGETFAAQGTLTLTGETFSLT